MANPLIIKRRALLLILGTEREAVAIAAAAGAVFQLWDVQAPEATATKIRQALKDHERVAIHMPQGHKKGRGDARRVANSRGVAFYVVLTPGAQTPTRDEVLGEILVAQGDDAFELEPIDVDRRQEAGPFDLIGDVHGCADELLDLLVRLGHALDTPNGRLLQKHPEGRRVILLGDLTDRGPKNVEVLQIAIALKNEHGALIVLGNHDDKLRRHLAGSTVKIAQGLALTLSELEGAEPSEIATFLAFLEGLEHHYILDHGQLVVAHAGLAEELHGEQTGKARSFALYGQIGAEDPDNPRRLDWAASYAGSATVVHGHEVHTQPTVKNRVYAIDTGCVFGGALTALRYPEMEFVAVPARKTYAERRSV